MTEPIGVRLTDTQDKKLSRFSAKTGFTFGDYIRASVETFQSLTESEQSARIMALRGAARKKKAA